MSVTVAPLEQHAVEHQRPAEPPRWAAATSPVGAVLLTIGVLAAITLDAPVTVRVIGGLVAVLGFADCRWTLHRPDRLELRAVVLRVTAHELRRLIVTVRGRHAARPTWALTIVRPARHLAGAR